MTTYYIKDSFYDSRNNIFTLLFFKDFHYSFSPFLTEGSKRVTLHNPSIDHIQKPALSDGSKFSIEVIEHPEKPKLILIDSDNNKITIPCDRITIEDFENTKDELLGFIRSLEEQMSDTYSALHKSNQSLTDILSFCRKQVQAIETILNQANWLTEKKKIEEETKLSVFRQIIRQLEDSEKNRR